MGYPYLTMNIPTPDKMTFLIVDDMDNMRRSIRAMLKLIGYGKTILEAGNGRDAWNLLDQNKQQVHFIVSDWNMPLMTGTELLNKVRADRRFRDIPFLMITAEANMEIVAEAAENDVDAYLTKPFVTVSLEKKIDALIQNAINPEPLAIHLNKVRDLEETGDIDGAIEEAKLAVSANERSSRPLRELGRLYFKKNDITQASACFLQAIEFNQLDVTSFHYLGQIYYRQGEFDLAIDYFSRAMDISPRHADRSIKFATLLLKKKLTRQAERIFSLVLKNHSTNQQFREEIAERCLEGGLYDLAIRVFSEALRLDPARSQLNKKLGTALRLKEQPREAVLYLEKAAENAPEDVELLIEIAQTYLDMGKPIPAERWATKVIRIDAENEMAKKIIARCD